MSLAKTSLAVDNFAVPQTQVALGGSIVELSLQASFDQLVLVVVALLVRRFVDSVVAHVELAAQKTSLLQTSCL